MYICLDEIRAYVFFQNIYIAVKLSACINTYVRRIDESPKKIIFRIKFKK